MNADYLLTNAWIVDGSGDAPFRGDLAVRRDRIAAIGPCVSIPAARVIRAGGFVVTPGFIDIHGHTDHYLMIDPASSSKVCQGVTTEVFGNCGYSPVFLKGRFREHFQPELDRYGLEPSWEDLASFACSAARARPSINWMTFAGHGSLRIAAMGYENRPPCADELRWMQRWLAAAMEQGACGLSTGLIYTPGCFAKTAEIAVLAKTVGLKGGLYATHMRSEGNRLIESIRESLRISRLGGCPLQISHLKTAGSSNWPKIDQALELLDECINAGDDISWDRYPYTASYTSLDTCLPRRLFDGGDLRAAERLAKPRVHAHYASLLNESSPELENTLIAFLPGRKNRKWIGKTVGECAETAQMSTGDFIIDLLVQETMQVNAIFFSMSEDNLNRIILHPKAMIGSDASARSKGGKTYLSMVHPRTYGTFPRFLKKYWKDEKKLPLETAVRKMTGLAAERLKLKKRGILRPGYYADLVVFDPGRIADRATYRKPTLPPAGIRMVFVNGIPCVENGQWTGRRSGRFLRYNDEN